MEGFDDSHLLFEKWNRKLHGRTRFMKGYGGWITIKNYLLNTGAASLVRPLGCILEVWIVTFHETINMINCAEARIHVKRNLCGFIPRQLKLKINAMDTFFSILVISLHWILQISIIHEILFVKDFSNMVNPSCLKKVMVDESIDPLTQNSKVEYYESVQGGYISRALSSIKCVDRFPEVNHIVHSD